MQFLRLVAISFDTWSSATNSSFLRSLDLLSVLVCVRVCCTYRVLSSCHENLVPPRFSVKPTFHVEQNCSGIIWKIWIHDCVKFKDVYWNLKLNYIGIYHVSLWSIKRKLHWILIFITNYNFIIVLISFISSILFYNEVRFSRMQQNSDSSDTNTTMWINQEINKRIKIVNEDKWYWTKLYLHFCIYEISHTSMSSQKNEHYRTIRLLSNYLLSSNESQIFIKLVRIAWLAAH